MPMYEYRCEKCGHVTTFLEKADSRQAHRCEACGSVKTSKQFSTFEARSGSVTAGNSTCPTGTCPLS